jgi:hypothetical protein
MGPYTPYNLQNNSPGEHNKLCPFPELEVQSNLSTTATIWTLQKRPLFKGIGKDDHFSQFITVQFWKIEAQAGHCREVAVVQRWPLTQV